MIPQNQQLQEHKFCKLSTLFSAAQNFTMTWGQIRRTLHLPGHHPSGESFPCATHSENIRKLLFWGGWEAEMGDLTLAVPSFTSHGEGAGISNQLSHLICSSLPPHGRWLFLELPGASTNRTNTAFPIHFCLLGAGSQCFPISCLFCATPLFEGCAQLPTVIIVPFTAQEFLFPFFPLSN